MATTANFYARRNARQAKELLLEGEHIEIKDLKLRDDIKGEHIFTNYLPKDIPDYPTPVEFHITEVAHVTNKQGIQGILNSGGFLGKDSLSWWNLKISEADITAAEERFLESFFPNSSKEERAAQQPFLSQFTTSPLFCETSRYGNFRFTYQLTELLQAYKKQICDAEEPVLRVYGTKLFKQEIEYVVLVHSPQFNKEFENYPELASSPLVAYDGNKILWKAQAICETHNFQLAKHENTVVTESMYSHQFYVWDQAAIFLYGDQDFGGESKMITEISGEERSNSNKVHSCDVIDGRWNLYTGVDHNGDHYTGRRKHIPNLQVFNDSIHGHIEVHPLLVKIIDTLEFQRLRNIKQLGAGYWVYPGASHNRFEHSIGDCHHLGLTNSFDHQRLLKFARVCEVEVGEAKVRRPFICFRDKEADNVYDMFRTRYTLHRQAYQHKTVNIIEIMIKDALVKANDHLKISAAIDNMEDFSKLSDQILDQILFSTDDQLKDARMILEKIVRRRLPKFVGEARLMQDEISEETLKENWTRALETQNIKSDVDFTVTVVHMDHGMKGKDPIDSFYFYSKRDPSTAFKIKKYQLSSFLPERFYERLIRVYYSGSDEKILEEALMCFELWCKNMFGLQTEEEEH
ncbi:Deoxynucleoside triphosphate triphosphohydrolase SAMHD1 [Triplophysa tibetana]|uniref:Deoxynucleoside triphosphate triphosphohydrolase SAMHD1 n=1 Tax=Triplophysa tibetana TaxID=1572043 RepID=A0A5A9PKK9_9TELE|nr:Deoxynucleoside triphosphate triphosphohydrolase SAMHD1 [Triplophysa tibetana]